MTSCKSGVDFVDAPVSGGVNAASAGTLTFMVGAETEATFSTADQVQGMSKLFKKLSIVFFLYLILKKVYLLLCV